MHVFRLFIFTIAVETGGWLDTDSSRYPDEGEFVLYKIVVRNGGTVTLQDIVVTDTSGDVQCRDSASSDVLDVGEWYTCMASRQVCDRIFIYASAVFCYSFTLVIVRCVCRCDGLCLFNYLKHYMHVMNTSRQSLLQLTQADINMGQVSNTATVFSTARNGEKLNGSSTWATLLRQDWRVEIGEMLVHC